ncbi:hypothetical protein [Spongiactinospora sp. TRM90649]|uniref:SCO4848 family membrane protein n=1 Tax=Spongiactinospora sp. TRM90649 TaxID=3031114 RepID=UPI0023F6BE29|nr:hypothetical protein [Spongiactinospora sp. TRM90649]MDF5751311.1 hypothetical protein [Spongiactinospora sp. TRM90649]
MNYLVWGELDTGHMQMSRRIAVFLLVVAAFMIFEWINLGFNLAEGHETSFYVVHGILAGVNILIALALGLIGWRALRRAR